MISVKSVDTKPINLFTIKTKLALVVAIVLWASAFVGIRIGLQGYSPGGLALLRFLIASVCMIFVYWRLPKKAVFKRKDFCLLLLFGAAGLGLYNYFLNCGEISIPSGIASFIISQSPLLTVLSAVLFLGESFNIMVLLGVLISIGGVGLISLGESDNFKFDIGMVYMLIAMLVNGLYSVLQKPFLKKYHAIDVTVFIIWGGTFALLIFLPDLLHDIKTAPLSATLAAVYLGVFPAAIAYIAWSYALAAIPVSRCVSFLYFMPVIATLLGWLCLGEVPVMLSLIGGLIALFGVWVANRAFMKGA
jgi:drug/metabolite transporter (DMT)-like permease